MPEYLEGELTMDGEARFAVVVSRFNERITEALLEGALDTLHRHGADFDQVTVARCPGAFEVPVVARQLTAGGDYAAVICLGAVIRGATSHYDHICSSVASALQRAALDTGVPHLFGILTCETLEQAFERSGAKAGNKGAEAAHAALETADLFRRL